MLFSLHTRSSILFGLFAVLRKVALGRRGKGRQISGSNGHIEGGNLAGRYDTGLTNDDDGYHLTLIITISVFFLGIARGEWMSILACRITVGLQKERNRTLDR